MPMVRGGGGGGGEAVSGDGLIYPEAFWGKSRDLDAEAIRSSAASLRALGVDVSTKTGEINAVWNELPASYVSPEAWRVYTLMGPAVSKADGIEDRFARGAGCLETFADELDFIRPRLADLEVRANAFRAKALAGVEVSSTQVFPSGEAVATTSTVGWREDTAMVAKNARLLGEYFDLVEQITMSSDSCARGLRILAGTQAWLTPGGGGQVGVITADQLAGAGVLPFGAPVAEDRNCGESVGDGFRDFGKGIVDGAGMLVLGYNPEDGTFRNRESYGQAWGGLGNLGGSMAVLGMFAVPGVNVAMVGVASRNEAFAGWIDDRADVVVGAGGFLVGYDHATAQGGGDGWHQWKEDGVRTATTSVLNIGTFFIPGAGAIGGSAKAGSVAAKVGAVASTAAEVIVPGGSWLLKGGASVVRAGEAAVTGGRTVTVAADAARLGKAGALTSLDNITERAGYTPARPRLTDSFNLESVTKPGHHIPSGLHVDASHAGASVRPEPVGHGGAIPDNAHLIEAELRDTFGQNPYQNPDHIPQARIGETLHGADIHAPEKTPALVGAIEREAGRIDPASPGHITNPIDTAPGVGQHLGDSPVPTESGGGIQSDLGLSGGEVGGAGYPLPDIADLAHLKQSGRIAEWAQAVADRHPTLTADEVTAIYEYTTSPGDGGSTNYREMNAYLRDSSQFLPRHGAYVKSRIDLAVSGMSKLEPVAGRQFRGTNLPPNVLDDWQVGETVQDAAFSSSSLDDVVAERFRDDGNAFIEIDGSTGVDVNALSHYEGGEAEILFRPGAGFAVLERTWVPSASGGFWEFLIKEVVS